jgi:hypothetical protein
MKKYLFSILLGAMAFLLSCNKDPLPSPGDSSHQAPMRKVRYELYTEENFSDNNENILFIIIMKNAGITIFDSTWTEMKIRDIPDLNHRIIVEKLVPGNDTSTLSVGFVYRIENVGYASYLDPFPSGDSLKVLRYSFK